MKVRLFHSFDFEAMIPLTFMPTVVLRINTTALSWSTGTGFANASEAKTTDANPYTVTLESVAFLPQMLTSQNVITSKTEQKQAKG